MYIWLNPGAEEKLANFKVLADTRTGKKYIDFFTTGLMDPTVDFPEISSDLIEKITERDEIHGGFRREGVYHHGGATLVVRTCSQPPDGKSNKWQRFEASAPNITELEIIYSLVRQGKLLPTEDWEAGQIRPSFRQRLSFALHQVFTR